MWGLLRERDTWHLSHDEINCTVKYLNQLATKPEDRAIPLQSKGPRAIRGVFEVLQVTSVAFKSPIKLKARALNICIKISNSTSRALS